MSGGRVSAPLSLYLRALYWSTVTFVTVGFGDIVPTRMGEMVVCMATMFGGAVTACVVIGLLVAELTASDAMASAWQQRVDTASRFVRRRNLPNEISFRIYEYLQYQWTYLRGVDEAAFFVGLPSGLRSEVLVALNDDLIRRIPYFSAGSDALIAQLANLLFPLLFLPDETLHSPGQAAVHTSLLITHNVA